MGWSEDFLVNSSLKGPVEKPTVSTSPLTFPIVESKSSISNGLRKNKNKKTPRTPTISSDNIDGMISDNDSVLNFLVMRYVLGQNQFVSNVNFKNFQKYLIIVCLNFFMKT